MANPQSAPLDTNDGHVRDADRRDFLVDRCMISWRAFGILETRLSTALRLAADRPGRDDLRVLLRALETVTARHTAMACALRRLHDI